MGWIFIRKKDGVKKKKKDAKNLLLGKSHLCFNQELQTHTLFPSASEQQSHKEPGKGELATISHKFFFVLHPDKGKYHWLKNQS